MKGTAYIKRPGSIFFMKTIFGVKKWNFFCTNIFHFEWHFRIKIFFRGFKLNIIQRQHFICLHHIQSQEKHSNGEGSFCSGGENISLRGPRIRGLRLPWPLEKHLHLAQLQQGGEQSAGKVKAVLLPVHQPPAAVYLLQMQMFCLLFSLASSSQSSHSCSATSWSLDISGPFRNSDWLEVRYQDYSITKFLKRFDIGQHFIFSRFKFDKSTPWNNEPPLLAYVHIIIQCIWIYFNKHLYNWFKGNAISCTSIIHLIRSFLLFLKRWFLTSVKEKVVVT